MSRSRRNSSSSSKKQNKSGVTNQAAQPIIRATQEQKRTIESQLIEQMKLEAEFSNPLATGISILLHIFLIQMVNKLFFDNSDRLMLENVLRDIDKLENEYKSKYGVFIQDSLSTISMFDNYKSDAPNNMLVYNAAFGQLLKMITSYAECASSPLSFDFLQNLQNFNLTTLYTNVLTARESCLSAKNSLFASASEDQKMVYRSNLVITFLGIAIKFLMIDPLVSHLYVNHNKENDNIPDNFQDAQTRIDELKIANKALKSLTDRNRAVVFAAALIFSPMITYQAWYSDEFPSELTMIAVYGYLSIFINIIKHSNKMWKEHWLKSKFEERKQFLKKIMPNENMYELTTQEGHLLETSFITLKIKQFKAVNYTIVSQIIKNELLRHGIKIEDYKEDMIVIRGDCVISASLKSKIKNNIRERLDEQNEAIQFSQQISQIADLLRDEQNQPIKETIIPQVTEFGKPYYCCYLKVPQYYRVDRVVNGEVIGPILDLNCIFDADIEYLEEEGIYKISGSKSADYMFRSSEDEEVEGFRSLIQRLLDANKDFVKRKGDIDFFKLQIEALSLRLNNKSASCQLVYGEDALPKYACIIQVPAPYRDIINEDKLKNLFPQADIETVKGGFKITGYRALDKNEIDSVLANIEKVKAAQDKIDSKKESDVTVNNNSNSLKRSKSDIEEIPVKVEKKPIIDFGNGVTYDPNIPEGCQFLQTASDPTAMDTKTFTKSAYILFNDAIYYFDIINNTCSALDLPDTIINEVKGKLAIQADANLTAGTKVLINALTRKNLNQIYKITNHEHHEQEVAPFEEASESLPKCTFFFRRLNSVMTEEDFVKAGFDRSVAKKAFYEFNKMTKGPYKANGRRGAKGAVFVTEPVNDLNGNPQIANVKLKTLGFFGDARLYAVSSQSVGPDKRRVLYTPVGVNPHAHN